MVRDANHMAGPDPCVWNGNEIVSAAEANTVVAGLAPDAPDEWGPLFAAAPEMYQLLSQLEWLGDAIGTVLRKARGEDS